MGDAEETAGATLGVEEEYHLLDPDTLRLANRAALSARAHDGLAGPGLHPEMLTSQLEAVTDVCTGLDQLRAAVLGARRDAARAAAAHGAVILAASTHPFAMLDEIEVMARPRYDQLTDRFGTVVRDFNLCGCHVHVSVPGLDAAVAIVNHARPYLPVLAALTSSSPFHEGVDTGYESFRLARLALWPQGGPPPYLDSVEHYLSLVDELTTVGLIQEPGMLLWELRPSSRYPTVEFRIADVCTDAEDVVLYAGLVRSLVRVLGGRVADGRPAPDLDDAVLRAARWRAARYGLRGALWSRARQAVVPATTAVEDLWSELEPDLAKHGEDAALRRRLDELLHGGTSAARQRRRFAETGSLFEVTRDAVALTVRPAPGGRDGARTAPASPLP